ncbi:uncharacterized protein ColSpa_03463 [Colletotrichum spaethianum]|uniref:Uncharacterized protein n=1 Tax=Colletotrichum spaethianum TaxID=700344 RepID=A0AA37NVH6_9PEZI|nr:uncharacterized protein ColSpa_03463 [Colletotrichum spaethianum]GKT43282.1 hypothetical protein ColSpa_03463 [Colletotrichum spaethianum]
MSTASGNLRVPASAEEKAVESYARLDPFLADIDLEGASSNHAGTSQRDESRIRRLVGQVATVNQLLPSGGGGGAAHDEATGNPPTELLRIGAHFEE